jgi:hypothetical protein
MLSVWFFLLILATSGYSTVAVNDADSEETSVYIDYEEVDSDPAWCVDRYTKSWYEPPESFMSEPPRIGTRSIFLPAAKSMGPRKREWPSFTLPRAVRELMVVETGRASVRVKKTEHSCR